MPVTQLGGIGIACECPGAGRRVWSRNLLETGTAMRARSCFLSGVWACCGLIGPAHAAVYCVTNGDQLQAALTDAEASAENDEVRLVRGTYVANRAFRYSSSNPGWIYVIGGYDSGCASRGLNAISTVLDGSVQHQVLTMAYVVQGPAAAAPRIAVENLTVQNGLASGFLRGGGIALASLATGNAQAELWLDNVIVRYNSGYFGGGADLYAARGLIRVVNSLFDGNSAPTSAFGHLSAIVTATQAFNGSGVIVANSTFVNGACASQSGRGCGINLSLPTGIRGDILNSVFFNNATSDVNIEGGGTAFIDYSLVGVVTGDLAPTITNAITGDPGFVDAPAGNFRLRDDSVLINRGRGVPPFDGFNNFDLDGNPRVRSAILDVGAYENQNFVFGNGFE